jgi:hypothetical protein
MKRSPAKPGPKAMNIDLKQLGADCRRPVRGPAGPPSRPVAAGAAPAVRGRRDGGRARARLLPVLERPVREQEDPGRRRKPPCATNTAQDGAGDQPGSAASPAAAGQPLRRAPREAVAEQGRDGRAAVGHQPGRRRPRPAVRAVQAGPGRGADYYAELPIDIKVSGKYHDIGEFAADMANLPRIVTLNNLALKHRQGRQADARRGRQDLPLPRPGRTGDQKAAPKAQEKEEGRQIMRKNGPVRLLAAALLLAGCGDSDVQAKCATGWTRSGGDPAGRQAAVRAQGFHPLRLQQAAEAVDPFSPDKLLNQLAKAAETAPTRTARPAASARSCWKASRSTPCRWSARCRRAASAMRWCRSTARSTRSGRPAHRPEFRHRHPRGRRRGRYP